MSQDTVQAAAEWQPSLVCFCPSCRLHINILRVPIQAGTVREAVLTVGAAYEGEILVLRCPNCGTAISVASIKAGGAVNLRQLLSEGSALAQA
jgi:hypothetical protein